MFKSHILARRLACRLVIRQLMLGALSVGATASIFSSTAEAATVLSPHGAWQGIAQIEDGTAAYGAMTAMRQGGTAAFVVKNGALSLLLTEPDWKLKTDASVNVSVQIDGATYTGHAVVDDRKTIEIPDVSTEVLQMFVDGAQAEINVNDGDIVWTLDLDGFTAAMADARRTIKASY